jgi:hypothetical protein
MDEKNEREETPKEPEQELGWRITEDELAIALEKVRNGFEW